MKKDLFDEKRYVYNWHSDNKPFPFRPLGDPCIHNGI